MCIPHNHALCDGYMCSVVLLYTSQVILTSKNVEKKAFVVVIQLLNITFFFFFKF